MTRALLLSALAAVTCLTQSSPAQTLMGRNLIRNADAEASAGIADDQTTQAKLPVNWIAKGNFTAAQYNGGGLMDAGVQRMPSSPGKNYFSGGNNGAEASGIQVIDISAEASAIDGNSALFTLDGYIGGSWHAWTELKAVFRNSAGAVLHTTNVDPVRMDDRDGEDGLSLRTITGIVPAGSRSVEIQLLFHPDEQAFNFAAADNLSFVMQGGTLFSGNLIQNGNAEAGDTKPSGAVVYTVPGWNIKGQMTTVRYGEEDGFPTKDDPGPVDRGEKFWTGGGSDHSSGFQWIDVTGIATTIDAGAVNLALSGFLGGYDEQADSASLRIRCLDASLNPLLDRRLGPVTKADRGNQTGLWERKLSEAVPPKTRRIEVTVQMTWTEGYTDGYADNISLILSSNLSSVVIKDAGVVNAASNVTGPLAPGEIISIYGSGLGPAKALGMEVDNAGKILTERAGVKVLINSLPAPLLLVQSGQVNAIVPFEVSGNVQVAVDNNGAKSNAYPIGTVSTAPGIFTSDGSGKGQALVLNQDYSANGSTNAAAKGSTVTLYCTGLGAMEGSSELKLLTSGMTPKAKAAVTVKIGDQAAEVVFAGAVPYGWPGLYQVVAKVPSGAAPGNAVPVVVTAGSVSSPAGVTMSVKN